MNKITNPFLQEIISGIVQKTSDGRMNDMSWGALNESKKSKKKVLKKEEKNPKDDSEKDTTDEVPEVPEVPEKDLGTEKEKDGSEFPTENPADSKADTEKKPDSEENADASSDEVEKARADAVASKAELEKAKAEKDKAEKDIQENSYVKLNSTAGVNFLLGKILDHAFKTDTIDALAGEMVQKLKIQTPEDFQAFSEEIAPYKVLPGIGDLLSSMKMMATEKQDVPAEDSEQSE